MLRLSAGAVGSEICLPRYQEVDLHSSIGCSRRASDATLFRWWLAFVSNPLPLKVVQ